MSKTTRCLFVDDHHISEIDNLIRRMNPLEKHPANPVVLPDRPWEGDSIYALNSAIWDSEAGVFKLWYLLGARPQSCLATSADGVRWDKPSLGLQAFDGSTDNNMLPVSAGQIVCAPDDYGPAPAGELYRSVFWSPEKGRYILTSADGLHWREGPNATVYGAGDAFVLTKGTQPLTGNGQLPGYPTGDHVPRYLGVARWCVGVGRFDGSSDIRPTRRVQALITSDDMLTWCNPTRILTPDSLDDEMAHARIEAALADGTLVHDNYTDRRCEFYTMVIVPYEDVYLGILMVFDAAYEFHRVGGANQAGPCHMQLVASRDLLTWHRIGDRQPFIPRGAPDEFDGALISYTSLPIMKDGTIWVFYTGSVTTHGGSRDKQYVENLRQRIREGKLPARTSMGAATLRRDGWVSLDAGDVPGYVMTKTFTWPENAALHLNADATGGRVYVSICQPDGTPYPGYDRSETLTGDHLDAVVRFRELKDIPSPWGGPHTHGTNAETGEDRMGRMRFDELPDHWRLHAGLPARLKITAFNAKLFSYWFT